MYSVVKCWLWLVAFLGCKRMNKIQVFVVLFAFNFIVAKAFVIEIDKERLSESEFNI